MEPMNGTGVQEYRGYSYTLNDGSEPDHFLDWNMMSDSDRACIACLINLDLSKPDFKDLVILHGAPEQMYEIYDMQSLSFVDGFVAEFMKPKTSEVDPTYQLPAVDIWRSSLLKHEMQRFLYVAIQNASPIGILMSQEALESILSVAK